MKWVNLTLRDLMLLPKGSPPVMLAAGHPAAIPAIVHERQESASPPKPVEGIPTVYLLRKGVKGLPPKCEGVCYIVRPSLMSEVPLTRNDVFAPAGVQFVEGPKEPLVVTELERV